MRKKRFLAAILLASILCFVVSGVAYGEVEEWMYKSKVIFMEFTLLKAQVKYIMAFPTKFLTVNYYYDETGRFAEDFPAGVSTKGKIYVTVFDTLFDTLPSPAKIIPQTIFLNEKRQRCIRKV